MALLKCVVYNRILKFTNRLLLVRTRRYRQTDPGHIREKLEPEMRQRPSAVHATDERLPGVQEKRFLERSRGPSETKTQVCRYLHIGTCAYVIRNCRTSRVQMPLQPFRN